MGSHHIRSLYERMRTSARHLMPPAEDGWCNQGGNRIGVIDHIPPRLLPSNDKAQVHVGAQVAEILIGDPAMRPLPFPLARSVTPRRGLTLVELMVVVCVVVVLLAAAGPSMSHFSTSSQMIGAKSTFASALALARSEAAKRGRTVILAARGTAPLGNEFSGGWDIVVDDNSNGAVDANDTLIRRFDALPSSVKLSGQASIAYSATGYLSTVADRVYTVCRVSGGSDGFQVTVAASGVTDVMSINSCS